MIVRTAVVQLARDNAYWYQVFGVIDKMDNPTLSWWWRRVNQIEHETWTTLRLKVIELTVMN